MGPPLEGAGGCLGRVLGAILEDVGSKLIFFGLSCVMLGHLGAKMANKNAKMDQDSWKDEFWSPVQGNSWCPVAGSRSPLLKGFLKDFRI